jgi:hypothetical protein
MRLTKDVTGDELNNNIPSPNRSNQYKYFELLIFQYTIWEKAQFLNRRKTNPSLANRHVDIPCLTFHAPSKELRSTMSEPSMSTKVPKVLQYCRHYPLSIMPTSSMAINPKKVLPS